MTDGPNYAVPHPTDNMHYGLDFNDVWYEHGIAKFYSPVAAGIHVLDTGVFGYWRLKVLK